MAPKLKVKVRLNLHGIASVELVTMLEEEEVQVPVVKESAKEPTKMETDETSANSVPSITNEIDENMQDAKIDAGTENGTPESGDKPIQMETKVKVGWSGFGLGKKEMGVGGCGFAFCFLLF
ncbi:heat shock 70 kDa 15-like [Olea europaea subsp. europaea]|uniref:Heat shock 70 kDa 15-like n=1 Tax=Olea europaea subsp. europaea TaxID=158383 RepID=A0A8S0UH66_OLEEU|nr:heat shock 70 kDa 15-like [Olea europaea subsp. europaea]